MLIKSAKDIENIKKNCQLTGEILEKLAAMCRPGVSSWEIDQAAEKMIKKVGGRSAFKGYKGHPKDRPFPSTICASFNEELVHGIAKKDAVMKDGDLFTIDIGMEFKGTFSDTAMTVAIGKISTEAKKLMDVTRQALEEAIKVALPGNSVAAIGRAVENYVKSQGKYGIVRDLVGHGVGHDVHEEPHIPNYYDPKLESVILRPGMVIAIEPMISLGNFKITTKPDGWTIKMADDSLCAHFEHTVIITDIGNVVATRRPCENY